MYELIQAQERRLEGAKVKAVEAGVPRNLVEALSKRVIDDISTALRAKVGSTFGDVSFRRSGVDYSDGNPIVDAFAAENNISDPLQIRALYQVSLDTIAFRDKVEQENGDEEGDDEDF